MPRWFQEYWWLIWGVACSVVLIAYRLRRAPEDDPETGRQRSLITRVFDPDGKHERLMPLRLLLVGAGLLLMAASFGMVKLYEWLR